MKDIQDIIHKLCDTGSLTREEIIILLNKRDSETQAYLAEKASAKAREHYGNKVFIRGLIEFTNYCRNDCYYCGIRCGNKNADRYRLSMEEIIGCASYGYDLGFRMFQPKLNGMLNAFSFVKSFHIVHIIFPPYQASCHGSIRLC